MDFVGSQIGKEAEEPVEIRVNVSHKNLMTGLKAVGGT